MNDQQRARELLCQFCDLDRSDYYDGLRVNAGEAVEAITAALRAAPDAVALRTAMTALGQIANAPDDNGAKFNAASCVAFLTTQGAGGPQGFVPVTLELLRLIVRCAYPVSTEIDPRGYRWSEAYLDEALPHIRAALLAARPQGVKDAG